MPESLNIADRLKQTAARAPNQPAVVVPISRDAMGRLAFSHVSFRRLDRESDLIADALRGMGVLPGSRLVVMVPFGIEFVSLVFGTFKAGAIAVLIDPGMGLGQMLACLQEAEPEGFLAIPVVHAVRMASRRRFRNARHHITVGPRYFWGGASYHKIIRGDWQPTEPAATRPHDPAAIIFTSGSTGPAKGVFYEHAMFNAQADLIRDRYQIPAGGGDLSGFPLFALFNIAMGVTTYVPPMDPRRPAKANPRKIVETIEEHSAEQAFGSPALWSRVARFCQEQKRTVPSIRRAFSAGAPAPLRLVTQMQEVLDPAAEFYTPYGATESLPVCSISGREILEQTAEATRNGAGTCVGTPFPSINIKIIEITDGPIVELPAARELPMGQVGEIIVQGPTVTRGYLHRPEADALAKIPDRLAAGNVAPNANSEPAPFWHRMGDVGYLDDRGRLWFCGRKSHVVRTSNGPMYTEQCEPIFQQHPRVFRAALVGLGAAGSQTPVVIVEPMPGQFPLWPGDRKKLTAELHQLASANPLTLDVRHILYHRSLPVDPRHNSKINREHLALWAANALHDRL